MRTDNDRPVQSWGKALVCGAVSIVALFFLMTRYSCSQPSQSDAQTAEEEVEAEAEAGAKEEAEDAAKPTDAAVAAAEDDSNVEKPTTSEGPSDAIPEVASAASGAESDSGDATAAGSASDSARPANGAPQGSNGRPDNGGGKPEVSGADVGGLHVRGETLGVILDVSDSMIRYLDGLRAEIRTQFAAPIFLEVEGCLLEPSSASSARPSAIASRESVMNAMIELIEVNNVDAIYWFSDLEDERTSAGLTELRRLVLPSSSNPKGVRLYVRSTENSPDEILMEIVQASGGQFEIQD